MNKFKVILSHIGDFFNIENFIKLVNIASVLTFTAYSYAMFIAPFFDGGGSWKHVHSVWYSWQALNVGMLAFGSSVIAFNISRYNAMKQREREFVAARAFLPESLSELTHYFQACSPLLQEAWNCSDDHFDRCTSALTNSLPSLPPSYKSTFSSCISTAEGDVAEYLAYILMRLQIHHSRLTSMVNSFSEDSHYVGAVNIMTYMYCLAELQALINKLFDFARGLDDFDSSLLTLEQYSTAYNVLDIEVEDFPDLWGLTSRIYLTR